ncbi:hypothetical protein [Cellulomonas sp.]|uniref:hypothetical protein n=1 Tax=Cellulomonas sp. TaxID=40001 RepID=UPI00338DEECC
MARRLELVRPVRVERSSPSGPGAALVGRAVPPPPAIPVPSSDVADGPAAGETGAGAVGAWGAPQTLQYPSS